MKTLHKTLYAFIFLFCVTNLNAQSGIASWIYQGGGTATGPNPAGLDTTTIPTINGRLLSPVPGDLDNDGDMDLIVGTQHGILLYYENVGTPSNPGWVRTSHPNLDTLAILPFGTSNELRPQLEDIDNDGDLDLFIGVRYNYSHGLWGQAGSDTKFRDIIYFENTGTPSASVFERATMPGVDEQTATFLLNTGEFTNLGFVDIDDDGDRDFFTIGSDSISYFENIGTSTIPSFQRYFKNDPLNPLGPLSSPTYTSMLISMPEFEDFDNDGDFDLYFDNESGFMQYVENVGTASAPDFSPFTPVQGAAAFATGLDVDLGNFGCLIFEDFDDDGVKDAIRGNFNPGLLDWWKGVPSCSNTTASINVTACDSYTVPSGDETYTSSGNYGDTIPTTLGCDSVLTINLTINLSATGTDTQVACDSYTWIDGNTYTSSNNTATFAYGGVAANGCDSIVTLDLTINNSTTGTDTQVACDSYTWIDGNTYTSSNNTATFVLTNAVGCDSTVTLNLTINNSTTGTDVQVACDSYTWIDGNTYTASNNTATFVLTNAVSCDSTVTLDLTINNSTTGTDTQVACDSYTWIDGNTYTASNNVATFVLTNAVGCDSTVTLDLTINNSNTGTDTQVACDSYTWIDGNTYTSSNNTATFVLTNAAGCDSTVTLDLTINNSNTGIDVQAACDSYTWIDGNIYTSSNNSATFVLTNAAGCDSTVTLDLTINYSTTGTDVQVACDSYTWIDGNTYTSSNNTATFVVTNAVGCDSTVTIDLTINNSTTGTDTQVACDSYTWIDGNIYTASNNTATFVLTNSVSCDSTVTLDLTINNSNTGTDVQLACDSYIWIDGNTYTASNNTATFTLTNAAGCDSIVTLDLTINNSNTGTDVQVACDSFTWIDGNTYTASNNTAMFVLTNAAGCDSTVTLDLTVNNSSSGTDIQAACDSFIWIDGNTYTSSNNSATFVLTNAAGCDSIVTLDLTINTSYNVTDAQVHCDSYTWIDGVTYTADNNAAVVTLTTVEGCDSIVTLDLTINTVDVGTTQSTDGITITADATGASYQWIDCDNGNATITGETGQSFTATANGNYAVIVNQNDCIDTSSCINVSTVGLDVVTLINEMTLYPNPTSGEVSIDLGMVYEQIEVRIINLNGQLISQESFHGTDLVNLFIEGEIGVYLIEVSTDENTANVIRVIKQ